MEEIEMKAREFVIAFQFQNPPLQFDLAVKCALISIDQILQTNPTIKGTSSDFLTQIVQTKAYYIRLQDIIKNL